MGSTSIFSLKPETLLWRFAMSGQESAAQIHERAQKNRERKQVLVAKFSRDQEGRGHDEKLKQITLISKDFEPCYKLLFTKERVPNREVVSLSKALMILPIPVIMYLGVEEGRSVTSKKALSFGLTCDGDDASCKG